MERSYELRGPTPEAADFFQAGLSEAAIERARVLSKATRRLEREKEEVCELQFSTDAQLRHHAYRTALHERATPTRSSTHSLTHPPTRPLAHPTHRHHLPPPPRCRARQLEREKASELAAMAAEVESRGREASAARLAREQTEVELESLKHDLASMAKKEAAERVEMEARVNEANKVRG